MLYSSARLLPPGEGQVPVLDHVADLPLHGDEEQHEPVEEEDRPEDGDVEHLEGSVCVRWWFVGWVRGDASAEKCRLKVGIRPLLRH